MKSTMSRYMDPGLADQLLGDGGGGDLMGGQDTVATLLIKQPDVWTFGFMPLSVILAFPFNIRFFSTGPLVVDFDEHGANQAFE